MVIPSLFFVLLKDFSYIKYEREINMSWSHLPNPCHDDSLTYVLAQDKEDGNPTHHDFEIRRTKDDAVLGKIHFQQGTLTEEGPNGVLNEDLLLTIIDRVESFQSSKLKCRESENALQHLYEALFWLNLRNARRAK